MKSIQRNSKKASKKRALLIIGAILLLLIAAGTVYALSRDNTDDTRPTETVDNSPQDSNTEGTETDNIDTKDPAPTENLPEETPDAELGATFTIDQIDSVVRVSTLIQSVSSTGSCILKFEKDGVMITREAGIQANPSSSTCKGFNISKSDFSAGVWSVELTISIPPKSTTLKDTITIGS